MNKIKKGDVVVVIAGKDKGKQGVVLYVQTKGQKLLVEGINLVKKHVKPNPDANERGGVVPKPIPIDRSNVLLYDSTSKSGSRVGIRVLKDGKRVRYFKKSDQLVEIQSESKN